MAVQPLSISQFAGVSWLRNAWQKTSLTFKSGLVLALATFLAVGAVGLFQASLTRTKVRELALARNELRFVSNMWPLEKAVWHLDLGLSEKILRAIMVSELSEEVLVFEPSGVLMIGMVRGKSGGGYHTFLDSRLSLFDFVSKETAVSLQRNSESDVHSNSLLARGHSFLSDRDRIVYPLVHKAEEDGEITTVGFVVQNVSLATVAKEVKVAVLQALALFSAAGFLFFFFAFILVRRSLINPLRSLSDASLNAARGVFSSVQEFPGNDDLGVLQRNFNFLIRETVAQLDTYEWLGRESLRISSAAHPGELREWSRKALSRYSPPGVEFELFLHQSCFQIEATGALYYPVLEEGTPDLGRPQTLRCLEDLFEFRLPLDLGKDPVPLGFFVTPTFPVEQKTVFAGRVGPLIVACRQAVNTFLLQRAMEALELKRVAQEKLFDAVPAGIVTFDAELTILPQPSSFALALLGRQSLSGQSFTAQFLQFFLPERRAEDVASLLMSCFGKSLEDAAARLENAPEILRKKTTVEDDLILNLKWVPLPGPNGKTEKIMLTFLDSTEVEQSRARLLEKSRLASLGQMAGGIAHEINNPLTVIHGYSMNLRHVVASLSLGDQEVRVLQMLTRIEGTVERAARIVKSLRSLARDGDADALAPVLVSNLVDEVLDLCRQRYVHHNIELLKDTIPLNIFVNCRSVQIGQVLLNLLTNAFDALDSLDQVQKMVQIRSEIGAESVIIRVADNGPGVPPEHIEQIFYPFFTTKEVGKGTGLGLAISLQILKAHGGRVWYERTEDLTCFCFQLARVYPEVNV